MNNKPFDLGELLTIISLFRSNELNLVDGVIVNVKAQKQGLLTGSIVCQKHEFEYNFTYDNNTLFVDTFHKANARLINSVSHFVL